jgi:hypothetical protein
VPHGQDVEGAAELEPPGLGREPRPEQHEVRQHLVALLLEVVLGRPQAVVAELVHELGDLLRGLERLDEALVRIGALLGRGAVEADVLQLDLAHVEDREFLDHLALQPPSTTSVCPVM